MKRRNGRKNKICLMRLGTAALFIALLCVILVASLNTSTVPISASASGELPTVSLSVLSANNGAGKASLLISVGESSAVDYVTVYYRTLCGTALPGNDYSALDENRQINCGDSAQIDVVLIVSTDAYMGYLDPSAEMVTKYNLIQYSTSPNLYYIAKYFYFEIFRAENGVLSGETKVKINTPRSEGFDDYFLGDVADGCAAATVVVESRNLTFPQKEMWPYDSMYSELVKIDNRGLAYYESKGGKLLYNIKGKTGRQPILGEGGNPGSAGFKIDVSAYRYPIQLHGTLLSSSYVYHNAQPFWTDADNADKVYNVRYDLAAGTHYNGGSQMDKNAGYSGVLASGREKYFVYYDETPEYSEPYYLQVYLEKFQGYTWYADAVWDSTVESVITDAQAPICMGYYVTNSIYTLGSTINLSVEFDEPVRIANKTLMPYFTATFSMADGRQSARDFTYVSGEGTNVLQFAYTLQEGDVYNDSLCSFSSLNLTGAKHIDSISDMGINHVKQRSNTVDFVNWERWQGNPANFSDTSTQKKELALEVNCLSPKVTLTSSPDLSETLQSATFVYTLSNHSKQTTFQYTFNDSPTDYDFSSLANVDIVNSTAVLNVSRLDGVKYLHVIVTNANGKRTLAPVQKIYFDNTAPGLTFAADIAGYRATQSATLIVEEPYISDLHSGFGSTTIKITTPNGDVYAYDLSTLIYGGSPYTLARNGISVELINEETVTGADGETAVLKRRSYRITLEQGMWSNVPKTDINGQMYDLNGLPIYEKKYFLSEYFGKVYLSATCADGLGNSMDYSRDASILMDTRSNIFSYMDITIHGAAYGSMLATPYSFEDAFYASAENKLTYHYDGGEVYIYSFKINGEELVILPAEGYEKDALGDYHPVGDSATLYNRYAPYVTSTVNGTVTNVECLFADIATGVGKPVNNGYYDIELKQLGAKNSQHVTFYVSADNSDSVSNSNTGLTENITAVDTLKLINSVYWVTEKDYMYRTYNKNSASMSEGSGFTEPEGVTEMVYFIAKGKPLVYSCYQAALDDMISREKKDISVITNPSESLVKTINQDSIRNADGKVYKTTDVIYLYKGLNYRENDSYYYYSSNCTGAIVKAIEANAKRTIGTSVNNSQSNSFRPYRAEGLGFDLEQIVDVAGFTIFNNVVKSIEFGACPISSAIAVKDYYSVTGVTTQLYFRKMGAGTGFTNIDLLSEGVQLKNKLSTTGFYELVEFSAKGASYRRVYIDCEAPILKADIYKGAVADDKTSFDSYDNGYEFFLTKLNLLGISDSDDNTLVAIYKNTGIEEVLLSVYQLVDINNSNKIILSDNTNYVLYVYDRSGNSIKLYVNVKSTGIVLTQTNQVSKGTYRITIDNRTAKEIVSSQLTFNGDLTDGLTFDNTSRTFNTTVTLNESGDYVWTVRDRYGYSERLVFNYSKTEPEGDFYKYNSATGKWVSIRNTEEMLYDERTSTYIIRTKGTVQFRYDNPNYLVTFYQLDLSTVIMSEISGGMLDTGRTYCYEIPAAENSWSLRLGYINDSQVFTRFTCAVDDTPPDVWGEIVLGHGTESITEKLYSNSYKNVDKVTIKWQDDETGVVKFGVGRVGEKQTFFTDMERYADGFIITDEGEFVLSVYDLLGNCTDFYINIDRHLETEVVTQGTEVADDGQVKYTNDDYYIYIKEATMFEFGFLNVKMTASTIQYYFTDGSASEVVTRPLTLTAEEQANPNVLQAEREIVNNAFAHICYGISKEKGAYLVLKCPDLLSNSDWTAEKIRTYSYDFVAYDSIGYCQIKRDESDATVYTDFIENGGVSYGILPSEQNLRRIRCRLSNDKFTTCFTSEGGDALADVRSSQLARYNVNFRISQSGFSSLTGSGDIVKISFRFSETGFEGKTAEYVELYPVGSVNLIFVENGEYEFLFESKYGTVFSQSIRLGKTIGAITTAIYEDGTRREIQMGDFVGDNRQYVYSNKQIYVSLNNAYASLTAQKDGEDYTAQIIVTLDADGFPQFTLKTAGEYLITIVDEHGNTLVIEAGIQLVAEENLGIDLHAEMNNWNEDALGYDRYSTNKPLGFKLANKDVYFVSYVYYSFEDYAEKKNPQGVTVYDNFLRDPINISGTEKLGALGDGVYEVTMRDKYGNGFFRTIRINGVSTVQFKKRMMDEIEYSLVPAETVRGVGLQSNYGVAISTAEGERYKIIIDGVMHTGDAAFEKVIVSENLEISSYPVNILDEYGNTFAFNAVIDRQRPVMSFADETMFSLIDNVLTTSLHPSLICDKANATLTYTLNDGVTRTYKAGDYFTQDGYYVVTARDYAGNTSLKTFVVDTIVSYRARAGAYGDNVILPQGIVITSGNMSFVGVDDTISIVSALKDGQAMENVEEKQTFTEDGAYTVTIADLIGNTAEFTFFIYKHAVKQFVYELPQEYTVLNVLLVEGDREVSARHLISLSETGNEKLTCPDNSTITFVIEPIGNTDTDYRFSAQITTDVIKPFLSLEGAVNGEETRKDVQFVSVSEDCTFYLYRGEELIKEVALKAGQSPDVIVTEEGEYRVVLIDTGGNQQEYVFTRIYTMNSAATLILASVALLLAIGIVIFLRMRNRMKVR